MILQMNPLPCFRKQSALICKNQDSLIKKTEIPKDPPIKDTHDWLLPEDKD